MLFPCSLLVIFVDSGTVIYVGTRRVFDLLLAIEAVPIVKDFRECRILNAGTIGAIFVTLSRRILLFCCHHVHVDENMFDKDISDPYGGSIDFYRRTRDELAAQIKKLADFCEEKLADKGDDSHD